MGIDMLQSLVEERSHQNALKLQSLAESHNSVQDHFNQILLEQKEALSSKIDDFASEFRRDFDQEVHIRGTSLKSLKDTIEQNHRDTKNLITLETTDRESEDHILQIGLNELREKADMFKVEIDDITRRLWDAIEMHTHDIQIDDLVEQQSVARLSPPGPTQVLPGISPQPVVNPPRSLPHTSGSSHHLPCNVSLTRPNFPVTQIKAVKQPPQFAPSLTSFSGNTPCSGSKTLSSFPQVFSSNLGHNQSMVPTTFEERPASNVASFASSISPRPVGRGLSSSLETR